jgi:nitrite reductase/ring-hydroxylating ferredoxin subunit
MREVLVAREDEIPADGRKVVSVEGIEIGLFRVDGQVLAWRNECPHQGGPVCQGKLMKAVEERLDDERRSLGIHYIDGSLNIVCPWHGFEFDVRTGSSFGASRMRLKRYPIAVREGGIYVSLDD